MFIIIILYRCCDLIAAICDFRYGVDITYQEHSVFDIKKTVALSSYKKCVIQLNYMCYLCMQSTVEI